MIQPSHEVNILITATMKEVRDEIGRAIDQHGIDRTPLNPDMTDADAFLCIAEEVGELAHELTYEAVLASKRGPARSAQQVIEDAEAEAIQVAAMAVAFVVGSRRRNYRDASR